MPGKPNRDLPHLFSVMDVCVGVALNVKLTAPTNVTVENTSELSTPLRILLLIDKRPSKKVFAERCTRARVCMCAQQSLCAQNT